MPDKKFSIVIAFLFLAAISLPAVQTGCNALWGTDAPASAPEDRKTPPLDSWFSRMRASGDYFNEHFGLREFLIRWNNIARVEALSTSPIPHAILGKNGWLFYLSEPVDDGNTIQDYRGLSPLSPGTLKKLRQLLEKDRDALASRGIPYIVVIAPNKNTLYGEYLPDYITKVQSVTRLDQLVEYMKAHSTVELLDLRDALTRAKARHPVYYSTDSHWNDYGAYTGYVEIMRRISKYYPDARPIEISPAAVTPIPSPVGLDIPQMLYMTDRIHETCDVKLDFPSGNAPYMLDKICFKHDSFGDKLWGFLGRHFKKIVGMAPFTKLDYQKIDRERPNVLLYVLAERYITMAINDDYSLKDEVYPAER